ncbi:MAG: T9SS type A sorting domain-containing protein, partial [Bacteroidota bacterium]
FVNNGTGLTPYGSACVLNFLTSTAPSSSLQVNSINECAASQPYRITIYIDATCRQSSTETFSDELIAYPNPASDHATLRFSSGIDDRSTLEVFDRLGSKVYLEEGISVSSGYNSIQLPAGKWDPGIYLVRLYSTSSGERSVRLVIE